MARAIHSFTVKQNDCAEYGFFLPEPMENTVSARICRFSDIEHNIQLKFCSERVWAMENWWELMASLVVFLVSHMVPMVPSLKAACIRVMGAGVYGAVYGAVSLSVLVWVIVAAGRAPYVEVLPWAKWQIWLPNVVMPVAIWLLVNGLLSPNPLSFGGRLNAQFRPEHPGIVGFVRHPLLWALLLWSGSHALANPDLVYVVVFGFFAVYSVVGMIAVDHRKRREMGDVRWQSLARRTSNWPRLSGLLAYRRVFAMPVVGWTLLFWLALLHMHGPVIGVHPFPMVPEFIERMLPGQWI
jgi:uncharacterized membrane protein